MAAQHRPHAGEELARAEGLRQVVVGAELEAEHPVDLIALRGQHDDRHGGLASELPREPEPVLARHAHVEEDQVDAPGHERRPHLAPVGCADHVEIVFREVLADHLADGGVVVDGEDALLHGGRARGRGGKSLSQFPGGRNRPRGLRK
jgi:hypothetical protein